MNVDAQVMDYEEALRHVTLLVGDATPLFTAIRRGGGGAQPRYAKLDEAWTWIATRQQNGDDIYVTMHDMGGKSRSTSNVQRIRAVWVDQDEKGEIKTDWSLEPSYVVETSPGKYHYVWLTDHDSVPAFKAVMQGMPGDPSARDAARVLRLAGTVNTKCGHVARLVASTGARYSWNEIEANFPPVAADQHNRETTSELDPAKADSALKAIPNNGNDRLAQEDWMRIGMAHKSAGGTLEAFVAWTDDRQNEVATRKRWAGFKMDGGIGPGTLYGRARAHGWFADQRLRECVERAHVAYMLGQPVDIEMLARASPGDRRNALHIAPELAPVVNERLQQLAIEGFDNADTPIAFSRDGHGRIQPTMVNTLAALRAHVVCGRRIAFDEFLQSVMICDGPDWRPVVDTDYTWLREKLEHQGFRTTSKETVRDALHQVAWERRMDSAKLWIERLSWDRIPRVEDSLSTYFGAEEDPYHRAVSRYLWTALAGRIVEPGVKADMVPVAVGAQGSRKSSVIRAMAPRIELFGELDLGARDDDTGRLLRGKVVVELGELKGLRNRGSESLKAFLSCSADEWIPKYQEHGIRNPRRFVFIGSSNRRDFLVDDTGDRRWLPFEAGLCDPARMEADRDQLWAEALVLFDSSGVDFREAEELARPRHEEYRERDPWDDRVLEFLDDPNFLGRRRDSVTSGEVLEHALGKPPAQWTRGDAMRVAGVFARLGWTKSRTMEGGLRAYRYARPQTDQR